MQQTSGKYIDSFVSQYGRKGEKKEEKSKGSFKGLRELIMEDPGSDFDY